MKRNEIENMDDVIEMAAAIKSRKKGAKKCEKREKTSAAAAAGQKQRKALNNEIISIFKASGVIAKKA